MSRWSRLVLGVVLVGCVAFAFPVGAADIIVNNSLGTMVNGGGCSLREAMSNVSNQDGGYPDCVTASGPDTITFNGVASITITDPMFVGDQELIIQGPITIDGTGGAVKLITAGSSGGSLVLNQVTIQNAGATAVDVGSNNNLLANASVFDSNSASNGAAINASTTGKVTLNACAFTGNDATGNGGAINKGTTAELSINAGSFINNSADRGGAIYIGGTSTNEAVILDAVTFQLNDSDGTDSPDGGGAIYVQATGATSVVSIVGCIFGGPALGNSAEGRGGAIYNNASSSIMNTDPTNLVLGGIIACDFTGNTAGNTSTGADGLGGAIYNQGNMHVFNSVFDSNSSTNSGGGAIGDNQGASRTLRVSNSTFNGNSAATDGGAISQFTGLGEVFLFNSTLSGNTAATSGREIYANGDVDLTNTIISNTSSGVNCAGGATYTDSGNNLLYDPGNNASCGLASGVDPLLGSLTLNLGPLPIRTMDLGGGSPALGAGSAAACASFPVLFLDARGMIRPTACDIGAFEGGDIARLVINEVDYDQAGGPDDHEFIEIFNAGSEGVDLNNVTIQLVDGAGGGADDTTIPSIDLPSVSLAAGGFYVVCGQTGSGLPAINCNYDVTPNTDLIENGNGAGDDPDAVGLRLSGLLIDTVSYEGNTGHPYTETAGVGLEDDPAEAHTSISRTTDGGDSDINNVDFASRCNSPGLPNLATSSLCVEVPVELMSFEVE